VRPMSTERVEPDNPDGPGPPDVDARKGDGARSPWRAGRLRRLAGSAAGSAPPANKGQPWTPPPPPARLVQRQGPARPAPRRPPTSMRPNLPGPPVSRDALVHRGGLPPAWSGPGGPPPPSALRGPGDAGPPPIRYPAPARWEPSGGPDSRTVITPDDDTRGRTVIDEERAAAQARRDARRWRDAPPDGVHFIETFHGPRLASRISPLRRIRSSFMLVVVAALLAVVCAALLAGVVGGLALAISHASGSG
jgi:hypothetical protein